MKRACDTELRPAAQSIASRYAGKTVIAIGALAMGFELTPAARIDHNYLPNDFTLQLFKTPAWQDEKARAS